MIPSFICRLILVLVALMVGSTVAHGQGALDKTTLGQSQNDSRDLANSLIPGPKHYGKGEKKEEVDPKKLTSKTVKDPKFEGSLVEMGLGSNGDPDLHLEKASTASDKDSKASKQADAAGEKDPKVSKQADTSGDKVSQSSKSTQAGEGQNKDQKATSAAANEKSSEKEKASANKPDGDH